jgi:quinol monooxygenase YgiN
MLVIAGTIAIDPAHRQTAVEAALEMMRETRKEPGCISYVFSADLDDPGRFRIFEEWESQAALDAHFKAPHMAAFQRVVAQIGIKEMSVSKYEISSVGPLSG